VRRFEDRCSDLDVTIQFLADLAPQRGLVRLVSIDLPARELPHAGEVNPGLPTGDEEAIVSFDDGGNDGDGGSARR
jgi:hypothetical protein